jgi:hypothetical protein
MLAAVAPDDDARHLVALTLVVLTGHGCRCGAFAYLLDDGFVSSCRTQTEDAMGVTMDKSEQRSNWVRAPLHAVPSSPSVNDGEAVSKRSVPSFVKLLLLFGFNGGGVALILFI